MVTGSAARRYDLVVAFDGVRSPVGRRFLGSALTSSYSGSVVWRKMLARPDTVTNAALWHGDRSRAVSSRFRKR
ncbi:hypothetical protein GCM10009754_34130 [Amycolatopsis minnesotensis]|uniref:Uncharacterized protein n=1 Tax=Amycolatopsis minnesotensis TaxID=337894 RepID=A0ABP5CAF5_9PSEU